MQERTRKSADTSGRRTEQDQAASSLTKRGEDIKTVIDDLLDEIDEVLENNAEEFVANYVQRRGESDSQAPVGSVSTLLAQAGSEDRQAAQPGHLQHPRGGGATRGGRAVLQTARVTVLGKTGRYRRRKNDLLPRLGSGDSRR